MKDKHINGALVIIDYIACKPSGEGMYTTGELVSKTKTTDTWKYRFDFKYLLKSMEFTDLFDVLRRDVKEKIISHITGILPIGRKEKISEHILRRVLYAEYFEDIGVVTKDEMRVSWVDDCHISSFCRDVQNWPSKKLPVRKGSK